MEKKKYNLVLEEFEEIARCLKRIAEMCDKIMAELKKWNQDIQLVSTDDLIEELGQRFEHFVFAGLKMDTYDSNTTETIRRYFGNSATCAGLASLLMFAIHQDFEEKSVDVK